MIRLCQTYVHIYIYIGIYAYIQTRTINEESYWKSSAKKKKNHIGKTWGLRIDRNNITLRKLNYFGDTIPWT